MGLAWSRYKIQLCLLCMHKRIMGFLTVGPSDQTFQKQPKHLWFFCRNFKGEFKTVSIKYEQLLISLNG